jgi:hypothetical protein
LACILAHIEAHAKLLGGMDVVEALGSPDKYAGDALLWRRRQVVEGPYAVDRALPEP